MEQFAKPGLITSKEVLFQIALHAVVFIFYAFERDDNQIEIHEIVFFLHYALWSVLINYYFLPKFFYPKKYFQFFALLILSIMMVLLIEELVLEKIFFPDTRGKSFGGVFFTLLQILPVITILSGFKFAWDALNKQREVETLKTMVRESELQFLKSQINPHFLFNNLNNLYAYAVEKSPKTPEIILELSSLLRYMLYECRENYVPLEKEVAQLKNFVSLSELQIEERGSVNFDIQNLLHGFQVAPLILIVFIENAFKHSTASQTDQIVIDIHLALSESGKLEFVCKNTFQPQSNTDNLAKGIGLENVKKRLQMIYPKAHELNMEITESFYKVELTLQLRKIALS